MLHFKVTHIAFTLVLMSALQSNAQIAPPGACSCSDIRVSSLDCEVICISQSAVTLQWLWASSNAAYAVICVNSIPWDSVPAPTPNPSGQSSTFPVSPLSPSTTYSFTIKEYNAQDQLLNQCTLTNITTHPRDLLLPNGIGAGNTWDIAGEGSVNAEDAAYASAIGGKDGVEDWDLSDAPCHGTEVEKLKVRIRGREVGNGVPDLVVKLQIGGAETTLVKIGLLGSYTWAVRDVPVGFTNGIPNTKTPPWSAADIDSMTITLQPETSLGSGQEIRIDKIEVYTYKTIATFP